MTDKDVEYFDKCYTAGLVKGRMLEVGSAKVQGIPNLCDLARQVGIKNTIGVDMQSFDGVDAVFDFGLRPSEFQQKWQLGKFSTVCVFNVLEHTFDPITVLMNALSCLGSDSNLLVVTPAIWPIHSYPGDYCRLLPDWYRTFAERNNLKLLEPYFCWLSQFGIEPIGNESEATFPTYLTRGLSTSRTRYWISRVGHKMLNTFGRSHWATHCAIGSVLRSPGETIETKN